MENSESLQSATAPDRHVFVVRARRLPPSGRGAGGLRIELQGVGEPGAHRFHDIERALAWLRGRLAAVAADRPSASPSPNQRLI